MQKLRDLYNCRRKLLKVILFRITKKKLQDKWINLFPTIDKGDFRCYLSHIDKSEDDSWKRVRPNACDRVMCSRLIKLCAK